MSNFPFKPGSEYVRDHVDVPAIILYEVHRVQAASSFRRGSDFYHSRMQPSLVNGVICCKCYYLVPNQVAICGGSHHAFIVVG